MSPASVRLCGKGNEFLRLLRSLPLELTNSICVDITDLGEEKTWLNRPSAGADSRRARPYLQPGHAVRDLRTCMHGKEATE